MKRLLPVLALLVGCGTATEPPVDLPPPQWVERSPDTAAWESGIRPWPDAAANGVGGIRLEWHALDPLRVGGYRVYRADSTDAEGNPVGFALLATLEYGTTEDTAYVDTDVELGRTYYYVVHAFDRSIHRREGPPSSVARFTLEQPPVLQEPLGAVAVAPDSLYFRWSNNVGYVVLRVFEADSAAPERLLRPVWVFAGVPLDYSRPRIRYNQDGRALPLRPGVLYRWRISRVTPGRPDRGASSVWQTFWIAQ
jgi:hypothetical protein